jgi:23S rRNA (uracil1939-C5)-methyltransferase
VDAGFAFRQDSLLTDTIKCLELMIEKLIYGGDGLARLPANERGPGKTVFVPGVLEGERVEAILVEEKPGFARARVDRLLEPSPNRIEPPCPYFSRCGGCDYQHTGYDHQLEIKAAILRETLRRQGKIELDTDLVLHRSPEWHYRNRTRFQVRNAPEFVAGFFVSRSHNVLAVTECPISSPLVNRALSAVWSLGQDGAVPEDLREIEFFADAEDARLLVELLFDGRTNAVQRAHDAQAFRSRLQEVLPEIVSGIASAQVRTPERGAHPPSPPKPDWTFGEGEFRYRVGSETLRASGGSFFQVNRYLVEDLSSIVTQQREGELALDLYAGVGLFTVSLAKAFRHVVAVESSQSSAADLKYNCPPNTKVVRTTVDEYLAGKAARTLPEYVVVDPPRSGLGERVARALGKLGAPRITYVSCDPATLARDLVHLKTAGYRVEQAHLVDLFPQTYHLESVLQLAR